MTDSRTATGPTAAPQGEQDRTWSIGELAAENDTTLRTIRFYEDSGLLTPERVGTRRIYHPRDRVRLQLILRGKRLGFSLGEIATIVDMYDAEPGEAGQLDYLLDQIGRRRAELEQRRADIAQTLAELDAVERRCRADLRRLRSGRRPAERRAEPTEKKPMTR